MGTQKTPNSQSILRKKNGDGGIKLPDFRLLSSRQYGTGKKKKKKGNINQWYKIESLKINPCPYVLP